MSGTVLAGSRDGIYLLQDSKGRTYVKGLNETRKKMVAMGMDRNEFQKYIKTAAIVVAREATRTAPSTTGELAKSIKGWASKKYTKTMNAGGIRGLLGGTVTVSKQAYGGVVTAGTPSRVKYARRVSFGQYTVAGKPALSNTSQRGYARRVWRETRRGTGNPYMVQARERMKPVMVKMLERRLAEWIRKKGFRTNGL
jgi:hypothetical protein